jgi:hypothetical protein
MSNMTNEDRIEIETNKIKLFIFEFAKLGLVLKLKVTALQTK